MNFINLAEADSLLKLWAGKHRVSKTVFARQGLARFSELTDHQRANLAKIVVSLQTPKEPGATPSQPK
jgi:hypothetical protein